MCISCIKIFFDLYNRIFKSCNPQFDIEDPDEDYIYNQQNGQYMRYSVYEMKKKDLIDIPNSTIQVGVEEKKIENKNENMIDDVNVIIDSKVQESTEWEVMENLTTSSNHSE